MEQTARHDIRHHIRLEVVPCRMCCRRRWCMLAVIDAGCRRHLQERADVLAAYMVAVPDCVRRQF